MRMREAGAGWVVTVLDWAAVQPSRNAWNWEAFDPKVQSAQAAGMRVIVLFHNNPPWAVPYPDGPVTDTQDLVRFLEAAVERYNGDGRDDAPGSPRVDIWSFYAEPDNGDPVRYPSRGHWGKQPEQYAEMLKVAAGVIHAHDARAWVMNGGLAYDWFEEDGGPFVRDFLTRTLQALNGDAPGQARQFLDAIAFHFYPIATPRWPTIREKTQEIRAIMERHGIGDLPLVVPEMGFWSDPEWGSSEDVQARRLVQIFVRGMAEGIRYLAWYEVFDEADSVYINEFGLFRYGDLNQPKKAYWAYRALAQELRGARYRQPLAVPGVEGYVFRMPDGREKIVLWAVERDTTVDFPWACLRLVDTLGAVFDPVRDGDGNWDLDREQNGRIRLMLYMDQPFYVTPCA